MSLTFIAVAQCTFSLIQLELVWGNFLCSVHTNAALTLAVQCLLTQQSGNEKKIIN